MKLYDLVNFRHLILDYYKIDEPVAELTRLRDRLDILDRNLDQDYSNYIQVHVHFLNDTISELINKQGTLKDFIDRLDEKISLYTHEMFSVDYENEHRRAIFGHEMRFNRQMHIPEQAMLLVLERLRGYTDWHYPGLELGCRTGFWTKYIVGCDPLYIVDHRQDFIDRTIQQFPELYQRRLAKYVMEKLPEPGSPVLNILPQNQFGFVFSFDYFNYTALGTTRCYLEEIYNLLRPGGTFMFSFNDGDTPNGASFAESRAASYLPKSYLVKICRELNFEIVHSETFDNGVLSWLEIRKPGTLSTSKAHQAMAEIKYQ